MRWFRFLLICTVMATTAVPAPAGWIFHKKKPDPAVRVPELLVIVRTDPDEHKRAAAAGELRQFDTKAFPQIVPILVEVLRQDAKSSVRLEAAQSLSRIRPVSQEAGMALEYAAGNDANLRVRIQARTSLVYYRISGYHSPKKEASPAKAMKPSTGEPPLASPEISANSGRLVPIPSTPIPAVKKAPEANKPPVADPDAKPLPVGPPKSPPVLAEPPRLNLPPEQGPELVPPPQGS
jgi:hypothetical protein